MSSLEIEIELRIPMDKLVMRNEASITADEEAILMEVATKASEAVDDFFVARKRSLEDAQPTVTQNQGKQSAKKHKRK